MAPTMPTAISMNIDARQLLLLLSWMSPAFPIGSFAYSHGLETAIAAGVVRNAETLRTWIVDLMERGSAWNDAVLFSQCWSGDAGSLNQLALALASSRERHLETTQLGQAFRLASSVFLDIPVLAGEAAYPVVAGSACRMAGIAKSHALPAFLQGFANAMISAGVRLIPLGQRDGLAILRQLMPVVIAVAERAERSVTDDLGSVTFAADIASMNHETLGTRIFRT